MERKSTVADAIAIMGENFIGAEELYSIINRFPILIPNNLPDIKFSKNELIEKKDDFFLLLGATNFQDGNLIILINKKI
jgi:hypothetical protein